MKKSLLIFIAIFSVAISSIAQCDPFEHNWNGATFGVSPNPAAGENFAPAYIGQMYYESVHVLCPSGIQDIDPTFVFNVPIDSVSLDSISIFNGLAYVPLSTIGLNLSCNNNGDSPNQCMFLPGNAYCGDISGTPTVAGEFPARIFVTVHLFLFGQQSIPYPFEGYVLVVNGTNDVAVTKTVEINLCQSMPNPANAYTLVTFDLPQSQMVEFEVVSLLGKVAYSKNIAAKSGSNSLRLDTSNLESGVYLYSIRMGDKKITKKLIVQH